MCIIKVIIGILIIIGAIILEALWLGVCFGSVILGIILLFFAPHILFIPFSLGLAIGVGIIISCNNFKDKDMEIRKTKCFIGEAYFLTKWYKESSEVQHYFAVCSIEGYVDFSIQKTWLGKEKYVIYNSFKTDDIIKYINYMYDSENLNFEEILEQNLIINDEIKQYFLNNKSYKWDQFGLSNFGNYTGADMLGDREFIKKFTLEERKNQIKNKENINLKILPPWYCKSMLNLSKEESIKLLIKKLDINNKFTESIKADNIIYQGYTNGYTPEKFANKIIEQTIQDTIKSGWINDILLDDNSVSKIINNYYLKLVEIIKDKFSAIELEEAFISNEEIEEMPF